MEKMNGNDNKRKFEEAPASLKSAVWDHFGFSVECDDQGKKTVDKQRTVCKHCFSSFVYSSGSTSNMAGHLRSSHPINVSGTKRSGLIFKDHSNINLVGLSTKIPCGFRPSVSPEF